MKRYLAFWGWSYYYPDGGMDDFLGDFDTIEECKSVINDKVKDDWEYSWAHIYDTETRQKVWSK